MAQKNGVNVIAFTPLLLGDNLNRDDVNLLKDDLINDIANKHGKTPAQIVLKSTLNRGIGVIPRTTNQNRLQENYESYLVDLTEDDQKKIKGLNRNFRVCDTSSTIKQFTTFD